MTSSTRSADADGAGGAGRADGVLIPSACGDVLSAGCGAAAGCAAARGAGGAAAAADCAVGGGAAGGCAGGAATLTSPDAPITATTLLTGTVSPSLTRISETTPAAGDGISASTLSVEISNSGSSRSTASPTFLIQRTIVPSAIDSPIWGITTSVAIRQFTKRRN